MDYGRQERNIWAEDFRKKGANLPIYPPDVPLPRLYVYGFRKKNMGRFTVSYLRKEMTDGLPLYCIEIYDALYRLSADGAKLWISICPHSAVLCATVDTTHRIACTLEQTDT